MGMGDGCGLGLPPPKVTLCPDLPLRITLLSVLPALATLGNVAPVNSALGDPGVLLFTGLTLAPPVITILLKAVLDLRADT